MKILLTGVAGFIGMHTALRLLARGDTVLGVDSLNPYYDVQLKQDRLAHIGQRDNFSYLQSDITDNLHLTEIFRAFAPERVIHLAAQPGVRHSLLHPHDYSQHNLVGFLNILEQCRHSSVRHLVFASSSSVYGGNRQLPYAERHAVDHPISLYAATKKANEMMAHSYSHLFGLAATGLRFFTVYGPWGRPDMAIFKFTRAILRGETIDVYNHGRSMRDFTYVDDVVESIVRVLDKPATADADFDHVHPSPHTSFAPYRLFNVGHAAPVLLMDFVKAIEVATGCNAKINYLPAQPGDVDATTADTDALFRWTGYRPHTDIQVGVNRFVAWFREYRRE
jgi:UDP-glucuronate 4-epimerase